MVIASAIKSYRNFTGGLTTDSSLINELENSVIDIRNMLIEKSGKISRAAWSKDATAYETTETFSNITSNSLKIDTYVWKAPNSDPTVNILVVRIGSDLYFFDLDIQGTGTYVLGDNFIEKLTTNGLGDSRDIQFTEGKGVLFYCGLNSAITYITYDSSGSPKFVESSFVMKVRDTDGIDVEGEVPESAYGIVSQYTQYSLVSGTFSIGEAVSINSGPNVGFVILNNAGSETMIFGGPLLAFGDQIVGATSGAIANIDFLVPGGYKRKFTYNFFNAGWDWPELTQYFNEQGAGPPLGAQWFAGKDATGVFDPDELDKIFFGNTIAPIGAILWNVDQTDASPAKTLNYDREQYSLLDIFDIYEGEQLTKSVSFNPSSNVFTQGRLFCSGANEGNDDHNIIYVSQVVRDNLSNAGAFHQEQDPTAEVFNQALDTDGFVIRIDDAINIKHMVPYGIGILAFADNGVWQLTSDTVFTPLNVSIRKVTDRGCVSPDSVVSAADTIFYFSDDRIMSIAPDPNTGFLVQRDISSNIIGDLYTSVSSLDFTLSSADRAGASGEFDQFNNRIYWIYNSTRSGITETRKKILVLDLSSGAYYLLDSPSSSGESIGMYNRLGDRLYWINLEEISDVNLDLQVSAARLDSFLNRDDDSYSAANTYFETFAETIGDLTRKKRAPWVVSYLERTEKNFISDGSGGLVFDDPSGCLMRTKWDWTSTDTANKYSAQFQIYRFLRPFIVPSSAGIFDYSYDVIVTKNKIRGVGRSVRFRFDAETDKNMIVLGWDVNYLAGGNF